jgi:hypothetical protein
LYIIIISLLGIIFLNAIWVGYSFSTNHFRFFWTLKALRATLGLIATIFFIPFLSFFVDIVMGCYDSAGIEVTCWAGPHLFKTVVTVVIMVIFIGYAFD